MHDWLWTLAPTVKEWLGYLLALWLGAAFGFLAAAILSAGKD